MLDLANTPDILPLADGVSKAYLLHHRVCPIAINDEGALIVATAPDALLPEALDDLGIAYRRPVVADGKPKHEVERLIARLTSGQRSEEMALVSAAEDTNEG